MATTTVPVTYDADAKARLDELGLHDVCEKMIEHILETLPNLQRLEVTGPYVEHLGPDQQIVFEAHLAGHCTIDDYLTFDKWVIENIPGEAGFHFVLTIIGTEGNAEEPSCVRNGTEITLAYLQQNRFTDHAIEVVQQTFARAFRQGGPGMVHPLLLLWSMLRWGYGIGIAALKDCSVDQWSFERDVASLLESVLSSEEKELFFDFQAISAVSSAAVAEAKSLGCSYVDTHHIIFALLRRDDEVIRGLFAKYGVTYERFKEAVDLLPARWAAQHLPLGEHERMVAQCKIRSA